MSIKLTMTTDRFMCIFHATLRAIRLTESAINDPSACADLVAMETTYLTELKQTERYLLVQLKKLVARGERARMANFRRTIRSEVKQRAESAQSGKQNTADKSELLPTQLPKAE